MERVLIHTVSYLLVIEDSTLGEEDIFKKTYVFEKDVQSDGDVFKWVSARESIYSPSEDNIGKCAECGCWTTDIEADNPIDTLQRGARVNGKLYCDEHLPANHPLAF